MERKIYKKNPKNGRQDGGHFCGQDGSPKL